MLPDGTTFFVAPPRQQTGIDAIALALAQIVPVFTGARRSASADEADLLFVRDAPTALQWLKEERAVLLFAVGRADRPQLGLLGELYPGRIAEIPDTLQFVVHLPPAIEALRPAIEARIAARAAAPPPMPAAESLAGLRILVVDDKLGHRNAAREQLGQNNDLTVLGSYIDALSLLRQAKPFDLVLTDLLMPSEGYLLGDQAMRAELGRPIAAGTFIALAALRAGVPEVVIVTDGNHHAHPSVAALELVAMGTVLTAPSKLSAVNASLAPDGRKDWTASYTRR